MATGWVFRCVDAVHLASEGLMREVGRGSRGGSFGGYLALFESTHNGVPQTLTAR